MNTIIIDLEDYDKSGKIDIKDLLNMDNSEILKKNDGKKFDICLMNPPYSKTMHLKFLEKTIQIADKVISIQPCGWLFDIPAVLGWKKTTYQRFEDSVGKHIKSLEVIGDSADDANKQFKIGSFEKIGIYKLNNNTYDIYSTLYLEDKRK